MKKTVLAISLFFFSLEGQAQSLNVIKNEKSLLEVLNKQQFEIDSSAKAVILYKTVTAEIDNFVFTYSVDFAAKILTDEAASDLSLINIPRYHGTTVYSLSAESYNLENGQIAQQSLEKKEIKMDEFTEGIDIYKFNLPTVKKGSVIHYKYKTSQPGFYYFPDYYLQGDYPILYQTYELLRPGVFTYANIERMNVPIKRVQSKSQLEHCEAGYYSEAYGERKSYELWVRRNTPAFIREPLMGSAENYKERIRVQVKSFGLRNYLDNWDEYNKVFIYDNKEYAGQVFNNNGFLDDKVKELTKDKKSDKEKAQAIYSFVRDSFNTKIVDKDFSLRGIFNSRYGSDNDLNLLLVAILRRAGLTANPVFLSPKPGEKLNPYYPDNQNSKTIVACIKADNKEIFLDASKKQLPFGVILSENYNGYARLIDEKSRGVELDPNALTEKSVTMVTIKPGTVPQSLVLKYDNRPGQMESYKFRKQMQNDTAEIRKGVLKMLGKESLNYTLTDLKVENLNNPDLPLKIHFEASLDLDSMTETLYFNPFMDVFFPQNPLTAAQRTFPIEMDYLDDKSYVMNLQLPEGYEVDDYPQSAAYKLNEDGHMQFRNIFNYDAAARLLSLNSSFSCREATYPADHYEPIRTFYGKVIEAQNQKIVIKKQHL